MDYNIEAKSLPDRIMIQGAPFEGFIDLKTSQVVFSDRGLSRSLKIARSSLATILDSDEFKSLCGVSYPRPKLRTDINSNPISVLTPAQLAVLVKLLADKKNLDGSPRYPVPKAMHDAGFPIILQQSVDEALGIERERREYLEAGATLRQKLEYKYSYHLMRDTTFDKGLGVSGLCNINKQVSSLAVPDADERRAKSKDWRRNCTGVETTKITVGNTIYQKAVQSSPLKGVVDQNLEKAFQRTRQICDIIDQPF